MASDPDDLAAGPPAPAGRTRSDGRRRAIIDAATTLFLQRGYQGTSVDEIAALAQSSKQTVYRNFGDKQGLFTEIVLSVTDRSERIVSAIAQILDGCIDLEQTLTELAAYYVSAVLQPDVVRLRRLVIAEAERFPELARGYFERAPALAIATLAAAFADLAERGMLSLDDPPTAAAHYAYLVLGIPLDRALLCPAEPYPPAELARLTEAGVRVFLAAYATA
jgi:TetR/AcrR family transcriptional regulator, mexJK operon transcriptional repressor